MKRLALLTAVTAAVLLAACARTVYEPVETVRTERRDADTTAIYERLRCWLESIRQKESSADSLIDRTKETVVLKENGDTARHDKERIVYVASHREKALEHKVRRQDSTIRALCLQLASVKSDTIPVPYPVERKLTGWEQAKIDFGGEAIVAIVVTLIAAVVWLIKKFRK